MTFSPATKFVIPVLCIEGVVIVAEPKPAPEITAHVPEPKVSVVASVAVVSAHISWLVAVKIGGS